MNVVEASAPGVIWDGPGASEKRRPLTWHRLLWAMVFPKRRHRIALTVPGLFLMGLALGIGTAAYNTASNILFITLSLLLACLLLSGLLSWFNFMNVRWRMLPPGPWRAGHETLVTVEIENRKRWLPTYSLWFELASQPQRIPDPDVTGKELKIREILAAAEKHIARGTIFLRDRVEPGASVTLDWHFKPTRRGEAWVELAAVGSLFPFGFLKKNLGTEVKHAVLVWPAQIEYQWLGGSAGRSGSAGRRTARAGTGDDLLSLRKYQQGDSHRLIHWKASARLGQMMIRQFAAESRDGYVLRFDTTSELWPRPEQFELACSLAATLAEDLFATDRLRGVVLDDGRLIETRRVRDVEAWLDRLARVQPGSATTPRGGFSPPIQTHNLITFAADGARGLPLMSTVAKPRQLNLDELLRLKWLFGGAMSMVALWTVFFLDIEALSLVAIAGTALLGVLVWPQLPGRVPPLVWKLAVPAIIVAMLADFYLSPDTLPVLIRLAILLVLYRAVSYRRKREDLQLLVLNLFLIVVAGVLTVSLGFAFLLLAFTACALGFLFVINLIDASESRSVRTEEAATAWTRLAWSKFFGRLRAVADWRLLTFAGALFLTVVTMSGLLFMIIPRFELASGFFLDRYITRKSRSGFSDTVKFGDVTNLAQDNEVAMRVDLTDASGIRELPYWRLVVLDEYTAEGFKVSAGLKNDLIRNQRMVQQVRGRSLGRRVDEVGGTWTFYVEAGVSRYLPLPGSYGMLRLRDWTPLQISDNNRIAALRTESMTMTAFQLEEVEFSATLPDQRFAQLLRKAETSPPPSGELLRYDPRWTLRYPEGPANEAVLRRIRDEITGGVAALSAGEFSRLASAWLQKRHAYSLSVKIPAGENLDPIVRWLDSNEPGFCEYFAAGLAVLARSAGHPSRVVAGFHGGSLNAFESYFMVKNSDAHAWVEVYDGRTAWVRFDPTPGNTAAQAATQVAVAAQEHDSSWSARVDSLRVLWYRRIVNFDSRQQVQMMEQVKTFTTDSGTAVRAWLEEATNRFKGWAAQPWDFRRVGRTTLVVVCCGLAMIGAGRVLRFMWGGRARRSGQVDPVRRAAGQWLIRLRTQAPEREVLRDLERLRYGQKETWPEPRGVFRRARAVRKR